jgi:ketol-acid reductoisomerase
LLLQNGCLSDESERRRKRRGGRIVNDATKAEMKKILGEIQSGEFADEWMSECDAGKENFKRLESAGEHHQIEEVGKQLRAMMPWLSQNRLVNTAKN